MVRSPRCGFLFQIQFFIFVILLFFFFFFFLRFNDSVVLLYLVEGFCFSPDFLSQPSKTFYKAKQFIERGPNCYSYVYLALRKISTKKKTKKFKKKKKKTVLYRWISVLLIVLSFEASKLYFLAPFFFFFFLFEKKFF